VEDEIAARRGLTDLIQGISPQYSIVGIAANGGEGLSKLRTLSPDVAFVDICMPVMDGLSMIGEAHRLSVKTAFIVISAYTEFGYARQALLQGALDYLVKPFTLEDVENVLKRAALTLPDVVMPDEICVQHPMVTRTVKIIASQFHTHISLESISEQLHITPEYLSYLFRRDMGVNFIIYLRNYRIEQALRMMKEGDMRIFEVANSVGFSDAKYFCRVFRNVTGQSPSSYFKEKLEDCEE